MPPLTALAAMSAIHGLHLPTQPAHHPPAHALESRFRHALWQRSPPLLLRQTFATKSPRVPSYPILLIRFWGPVRQWVLHMRCVCLARCLSYSLRAVRRLPLLIADRLTKARDEMLRQRGSVSGGDLNLGTGEELRRRRRGGLGREDHRQAPFSRHGGHLRDGIGRSYQ